VTLLSAYALRANAKNRANSTARHKSRTVLPRAAQGDAACMTIQSKR
jgi:hypothetical protein